MNPWICVTSALGNLRANPLRTSLTMLGIIIGVSTVILMVGIVEGARHAIVQEFQKMGSDMIIIVYDPKLEEKRKETRRIEGLTMDDARYVRAQCDSLGAQSVEVPVGTADKARRRDVEAQATPRGVEPDYARLRNFQVKEGRFLQDEDLADWKKVCVIGELIREELFPQEPAVGGEIEVGGITLQVVGVLEPKGRGLGNNEDRIILLPATTAQKRFVGREVVGILLAQPRPGVSLEAAMDQVWACLMRRHDNLPGFRVDSQENILNSIGRVLTVFSVVLGSIAGLALLVGGIGIMNIMLVSVTERTREIGIRKAVGATRRDLLWQFLLEAATVSAAGGLVGIGLGAGVAHLAGHITRQMKLGPGGTGFPIFVPLWAILGAFFFSAAIGVFFGIYPAARAAQLDPIVALRHE